MSPERALPTVLVVDDSGADRRLVSGLLERSGGLTVESAKDGQEAIDRFQSDVPDLVVTDLIMPEMDGLALVATVKSEFPLVPVVLMTARGNEEIALGRSARERPATSPSESSRRISPRRSNASWPPRGKTARSRGSCTAWCTTSPRSCCTTIRA